MEMITWRLFFFFTYLCNYKIYSILKNLHFQNSLNEDWYVSYVTRTEAEAALRKINQVLCYRFIFLSINRRKEMGLIFPEYQ